MRPDCVYRHRNDADMKGLQQVGVKDMRFVINRRLAALLLALALLAGLSLSALAEDDAPVIMKDLPSSVTVPAGGSLTLTFEASGPDLQYQWYKDNAPLSGRTEATFTIQSVSEGDAGQYSCYVQNPYGGALSATCYVYILEKPVLVQDINITSLTLNAGDSISLTAQATGTNVTAQWYYRRGETEIHEIAGQNTGNLSVTATEEYNGVEIYCQFVNEAGGTVTSFCSVTVNPAPTASPEPEPPKVTKSPTGEIVGAGGSAIFIAHAENASSRTWRLINPNGTAYDYNNNSLSTTFPGLVISGGNTDTLTLSNIPYEMNSWSVACLFKGDGGETLTDKAFIQVTQPVSTLSIITQPVGGTMGISENPDFTLSIQASADSGGRFSYQWFSSSTGTSTSMRPISGATNSSYKPERTEGTTYYRVSVTLTANNGITSEPYYSNTVAVTFTAQKAHEHVYSTAWEHNDLSHWHQCTCGDHGDEQLHTFIWEILDYPTADREGQQKGVCSICGYETIQPIPAGSMTPPPSDDAPAKKASSGRGWITVLIIVLALAVIGTAGWLVMKVLRADDEEDADDLDEDEFFDEDDEETGETEEDEDHDPSV